MNAEPLKEPLAAFVPFGHRLARKTGLTLRELAGEAMVSVSSDAAPTFASHLQKLCADAGFRPRIVLESPRAQAVAVMVAAGSGIALLPASLGRVLGPAAAIIPLRRVPQLTHVFALRTGTPSAAMRRFLELIKK